MGENLDVFFRTWEAEPITNLAIVLPDCDPLPLLKLLPTVVQRNNSSLVSFRLGKAGITDWI